MAEPPYDFVQSLRQWARVPVDDLAYFDALELLSLHPEQMREVLRMANTVRWAGNGWRNHNGSLQAFMSLDKWDSRLVMDFGCGLGLDALAFAEHGARMCLADLHASTLLLAQSNLALIHNIRPIKVCLIGPSPPWFMCPPLDLFWSYGVLHHTPHMASILHRACYALKPGGECRIAVYSDYRWRNMMGCDLPQGPLWEHPGFAEFAAKCDTEGQYADCYDAPKLARLVEPFAVVKETCYLGDQQMLGAVIVPRG